MSDRSAPQVRERWRALLPAASILAAAVGALALATQLWPATFSSNAVGAVTNVVPFPVAFILGLLARRWSGLAGVTWMAVCVEISQGYLNPFVIVFTFGPWYAGTMIRARRLAARQLASLTLQLEEENDRFTEQTLRLERARIAHELHDIVAHNVSVMVIQAYAGARLASTDAVGATDAFKNIHAAATQAHDEIEQLVELLAVPTPTDGATVLPAGLAELVTTAAATGIPVTLRAQSGLDELPPPVNATAYRIVQEALTNALKYAPGAPIDITITRTANTAHLVIANGASTSTTPYLLQTTGGGHGIAGMRDRVTKLGGHLHAGPNGTGWRVTAELPL